MRSKVFNISILVLLHLVISSGLLYGFEKGSSEKNYVPKEVLVRFHDWAEEPEKNSLRNDLNASLVNKVESIGVEQWSLTDSTSVEDAINVLENSKIVDYAEPNYYYKPQALPNDAYFNHQWHLRNIGQTINSITGTRGADISAQQAWDIEKGDSSIVIAVIDSGVAYDHPDLRDNIWTNVGEIPGNQIDDDGNGYIDDTNGWDFVNNDNMPLDYSKDLHGDGHGTHVAGIIAAKGNNSIGGTGVMWNAQIMPLQVFDLFQTNSFGGAVIQHVRIIDSIEYAVDNGAKIINCSLGGGPPSQFMYDIINYAHQNGVLLIAAAGNGSQNNDSNTFFPASYELPNIISVAATTEKDELASYSNFGTQSVDVAAPGGSGLKSNFYSTAPPERIRLFFDDFESGGNRWITGGTGLNGYYKEWSITYDPVFGSNVLQDSQGNYWNFENKYVRTQRPINTSTCKGLHLQYLIDYSLEYNYDWLYFELSYDGINYTSIPSMSCTGFSNGVESRRAWGNDIGTDGFYLGFRLVADSNTNFDGVYIDNVIVTGVPWQYNGGEYGLKSGTSMAAPVVAGIAGLLWSQDSTLSHLEVKDVIMNTVDQLDCLENVILSQGRVNAQKALLSIQNNQTRLYFPHVASYNAWETEFSIINRSGSYLSGTLAAYSHGGVKLSERGVTLAGNGRRSFVVGEAFSNPDEITHIIFTSDSSNTCGYSKLYKEGRYRVSIPAVQQVNSNDIYIPHIASNNRWQTDLYLLNTTESRKILNINFSNGEIRQITLAAGRYTGRSIKSFFGGVSQPSIESAVITGGEGVIGLELFSQGALLSGVLLTDESANTLYFPHVADIEKWWTGIVAYNPNYSNATLAVTSYTDGGVILNDRNGSNIGAGGRYFGNAQDLNLPASTAWFKIESTRPLCSFELFGTNDGKLLAGYSTVNINHREGIFPKIDDEGWTGIAFVNTTNDRANIALSLYDNNGFKVSEQSISLDGYEKVLGHPENIFSGSISAATYMKFSSNKDVVGFQLNGSSDGMMLDALPGM